LLCYTEIRDATTGKLTGWAPKKQQLINKYSTLTVQTKLLYCQPQKSPNFSKVYSPSATFNASYKINFGCNKILGCKIFSLKTFCK